MPQTEPPPRPLAADFADRLEALRKEAADLGHGDIDYIIEMAVMIADKRISAQGMVKPMRDQVDLRRS